LFHDNSSGARPGVAAGAGAAPVEADSDDDDDDDDDDHHHHHHHNNNNSNDVMNLLEDDPGDDDLLADVLRADPPIVPATLEAHPNALPLLMNECHKEVRQFIYSCVIESSIRGR
jgi:hypothetical protein